MRQYIIKMFCRAQDQEEREGAPVLYRCAEVLSEGLTDGQEGHSQCSHPSPVTQLHGDTVAEMISSGPSQGGQDPRQIPKMAMVIPGHQGMLDHFPGRPLALSLCGCSARRAMMISPS